MIGQLVRRSLLVMDLLLSHSFTRMDHKKWRLCLFTISLVIVKGMTIGDDVLRQSRPRTREFVNTSINSPFMFQEITTKHSGKRKLVFKHTISRI